MHLSGRTHRFWIFLLYGLGVLTLGWLIFTFLYQYVAALGSFREVASSWRESRILSALWLSIASSFATLFFGVLLGVPAAYLFGTKKFRGKALIETLSVDVPQTFPPVAEGMIYLFLLGPNSPIDLNLAFTFSALVIAKFYVCAPFVISFVARRFREIKESGMSMTARCLGASRFQVLWRIYLPLSIKEISAGAAMCWSRAMGELGGSLVFAGVIPFKTEIIPNFIGLEAQTMTIAALGATILITTASALSLVSFKLIMKN